MIRGDSKTYQAAEKQRCSLRYAIVGSDRFIKLRQILEEGGLDTVEAERYLFRRMRTDAHTERECISGAVDTVFARMPAYPARFNTASFNALYTAKEIETALAERAHYIHDKDRPVEYVVFSVLFEGEILDIRPDIASGEIFPEEHVHCQPIAVEAKARGFVGVAAPSKRRDGGSCCALFERSTVAEGVFTASGSF